MALVTRFLNPASSGGDGTTNALSGANAAYATFAAWQTAEATNLVTDGDVHKLFCEGSALSESIIIGTGWTTDITNYILVTVTESSRHDGTPGTGFRISGSDNNGVVILIAAGTIIEFVEITSTRTFGNANALRNSADDTIIQGCIATTDTGASSGHGFNNIQDDGGVWINDLAYECGGDGFNGGNFDSPEWYNCTSVDNSGDGFARSGGDGTGPTAKNCATFGNAGTDYTSGVAFVSSNNNADEDATAPGGSSQTPLATGDFTDPSSDDYSVADTDSLLFNNGADIGSILSALDRTDYTVPIADIISISRPQSTSFDIGAFEFVVAAAATRRTNLALLGVGS